MKIENARTLLLQHADLTASLPGFIFCYGNKWTTIILGITLAQIKYQVGTYSCLRPLDLLSLLPGIYFLHGYPPSWLNSMVKIHTSEKINILPCIFINIYGTPKTIQRFILVLNIQLIKVIVFLK